MSDDDWNADVTPEAVAVLREKARPQIDGREWAALDLPKETNIDDLGEEAAEVVRDLVRCIRTTDGKLGAMLRQIEQQGATIARLRAENAAQAAEIQRLRGALNIGRKYVWEARERARDRRQDNSAKCASDDLDLIDAALGENRDG